MNVEAVGEQEEEEEEEEEDEDMIEMRREGEIEDDSFVMR